MVVRPEKSLPVVGNVRDHALLEGNPVNVARHGAQVLRIVVDLGHPHKRVVGPLWDLLSFRRCLWSSTAIQAVVDRPRRLQFG